MESDRRGFLKLGALAALGAAVPPSLLARSVPERKILKPARLKKDAVVGLVAPAGAVFQATEIGIVKDTLSALGLRWKLGDHLTARQGYLAGTDAERAADLNAMFADEHVDAIMAVRGGWGCNRILPLLDYTTIARHPKILIGYSDITSLLLAIFARTGLVTFHGPVGSSTWNRFTVDYFRRILFDAEAVTMANPQETGDSLVKTKDRVETITPGIARGKLLGGNLSLLTSMIGTEYLPAWEGSILFLEDDGEYVYRVDRMLTQLALAGVLRRVAGVVFGKCTNCGPGDGYGSLTIEDLFEDHLRPLGVPAWSGAMIGHIENKFTVPLGIDAEIDARAGTIRLLESAVQ
jgi:muramoyltetrapeptide carboxypeptidase